MLASTKLLRWQYNGVAPMNEIADWCGECFGPIGSSGRWSHIFETIYFDREEDYTWFMLRWSSK